MLAVSRPASCMTPAGCELASIMCYTCQATQLAGIVSYAACLQAWVGASLDEHNNHNKHRQTDQASNQASKQASTANKQSKDS